MNKLAVIVALLASCKEKEQKPATAPPPAPAAVAPAPPKLPEPDAAPPAPALATQKELPDTCKQWRVQLEQVKDCPAMRRRVDSMRRGYAAIEKGWDAMELSAREKLVTDCGKNADDLASAARADCPK